MVEGKGEGVGAGNGFIQITLSVCFLLWRMILRRMKMDKPFLNLRIERLIEIVANRGKEWG